jgi:hypothetical protein
MSSRDHMMMLMAGCDGKDDARQHSGHRLGQRRACEQSISPAGTSWVLEIYNRYIA